MQFYNLDDPIVKRDVTLLKGKPIDYVLRYLVDRLKTLRYINYGKVDTFQAPSQMFSRGNFDCEDGVGYVASVLEALGIPHHILFGKVDEYPEYYHVWIELPVDGVEYVFETTAPMVLPKSDVTVHYRVMEVLS